MTVRTMYALSSPNFIGKFAILTLDDDVVIDKTTG